MNTIYKKGIFAVFVILTATAHAGNGSVGSATAFQKQWIQVTDKQQEDRLYNGLDLALQKEFHCTSNAPTASGYKLPSSWTIDGFISVANYSGWNSNGLDNIYGNASTAKFFTRTSDNSIRMDWSGNDDGSESTLVFMLDSRGEKIRSFIATTQMLNDSVLSGPIAEGRAVSVPGPTYTSKCTAR